MSVCPSCKAGVGSGSVCLACAAEIAVGVERNPPVYLTSRDYAVIESLLNGHAGLDPFVRAEMRAKLRRAAVVFPADISRQAVTLNSRVRFRLNDLAPQARTLVADLGPSVPGAGLSVATPTGIALLGLSEGETWATERPGGPPFRVEVIAVLYQPPALGVAGRSAAPGGGTLAGPGRLGAEIVAFRAARLAGRRAPRPDGDDPGPAAA